MFISNEALQAAQMVLAAAAANQQKPKEEKKLLKMKDACALAQVSRWTMSRWLKAGYVKGIKFGESKNSHVRIYEDSLRDYLKSLEIQGKDDESIRINAESPCAAENAQDTAVKYE